MSTKKQNQNNGGKQGGQQPAQETKTPEIDKASQEINAGSSQEVEIPEVEAPSEGTTVIGEAEAELKPHQLTILDVFKAYIADYEKSHASMNPQPATARAGFTTLHGAVRHLVGAADAEAQKACFRFLVTRIATSGEHKNEAHGRAYAMPKLISYLGDDSEISSSTERIFQAEFLTLIRKFALSDDKGNFIKNSSVERTLDVVSDEAVKRNLLACFGG